MKSESVLDPTSASSRWPAPAIGVDAAGSDVEEAGRRRDSSARPRLPHDSPMVQRLLARAFREHQAGRLQEAKRLYLKVLSLNARHAKSLFGLGLAEYQLSRFESSARILKRAIAADGDVALYHSSLGAALHSMKQFDAAAAAYEQALEIEAANEDFYFALGNVRLDQKQWEKARSHFQSALRLKPDRADTHVNLGNVFLEMKQLDDAQRCYARALQLQPRMAEALTNMGSVQSKQGKFAEAEDLYRRALAVNPNLANAHNNLGNALREQGKLDEACACFERALALRQDYGDAHNNFGVVLQVQGRLDEAAAHHARAVELHPQDAGAWNNLGVVWRELGELPTAAACHERAIALQPGYAEAFNNLGVVLRDQGRLDDAAGCHQRALALKPDYGDAENNLGNVRRSQGRLGEARACYERALLLKPHSVDAAWNRCLVDLLEGKYEDGWRRYEIRTQRKKNAPRVIDGPLWRGEPLEGARILLHSEQGLGDTLQFLRYVPLVRARGGRVELHVQEALRRLAAQLPGLAAAVTPETSGNFDWQCPLMSLPLAFGTTVATIPQQTSYLTVPEDALRAAALRPWPEHGLRVGLVWSGNPRYTDDRVRSVPFALMAPHLDRANVRLFSLQMGAAADQMADAGIAVTDLREAIGDMADTAALVRHLDLVITVDTAVAHLGGALGWPTWVLLPFAPDWRWLTDREDSPWYPTVRLFRQRRRGDWGEVMERVGMELSKLADDRERRRAHV